jgi:hypothetical protein
MFVLGIRRKKQQTSSTYRSVTTEESGGRLRSPSACVVNDYVMKTWKSGCVDPAVLGTGWREEVSFVA